MHLEGYRHLPSGRLAVARYEHTVVLLPTGKVLVVGGLGAHGGLASAEEYDPVTGTWSGVAPTARTRAFHTATLLPTGQVLVVGGMNSSVLASAELFDPSTEQWEAAGALATARSHHTACVLPTGDVLVAGGHSSSGPLAGTELYVP
ncbi:MAG: Kelch repeat-containing protein [Hyalangium sp.]